ncbi:MAG TPA: spermidine/putrescine ABC transporter substrate-binding protein [Streptosporangiaceae bacterium]|nr:spermidine/putrescine ABC transporter substrate-binding protein [Streptosporangiaceae bacterium]
MSQREDRASATPGVVSDPSVIRGLTRRRLLTAAGASAGLAGLAGLLSACGDQAAAPPAVDTAGTPAWWRSQRLHHLVNFANWPDYIDVLNGRHPSLERFTQTTGITVNYTEPVSENMPFFDSISPQLKRGQYTGYDVIVTTTNSPALGSLISNGWLIPLDQAMMSNFRRYASSQVKSPPWDPGNVYTMAWQSGWTAIGYNSRVISEPGDSVALLFDERYKGRVGMMSDPWELGSIGLLRNGVWPALSTESDWRAAATTLRAQRDAGIVRGYYGQNYIDYLTSGQTVVSQAFSGDIYQARISGAPQLRLLMPLEGAMFWTDNMCIPQHSQNPKDAMAVMDYFYQPQVQAVVEYSIDYVCPVPAAQQVLRSPTGWAAQTLAELKPSIGVPVAQTASSAYVFPTGQMIERSRYYYQFENADQLAYWTSLFKPIAAGH